MEQKEQKFHFEHWYFIAGLLLLYDAFSVNVSYFLALLVRFDFKYSAINSYYIEAFLKFAPYYTGFCLVVFWALRLYRSIWRFASYTELVRISFASAITCAFQIAGTLLYVRRMPISYYLMGFFFQFFLVLVIRFSYRFVLLLRSRSTIGGNGSSKRIMLIGAGNAGQLIIRDFNQSSQTEGKICCIIDDNPNKKGRFIEGIPVVGDRHDILANVEKYNIDTIFLAVPSATAEQRRDILNICSETGCELKNLPGLYQFATGEVSVAKMKDVAIEDLLGREAVQVDLEKIFDSLYGKTILVTGGGGSIGSELCRQIAAHSPKRLVIFDIYENNAYDIQQELKRKYPKLDLVVLIGSVRDSLRVNQVFELYKPDIVYHAAAHKHVPLMEMSPDEAIKNNVFGTYKVAYAAMMHGAQRFVLISTDKAVNPTNIMGASKRMCEMIIQSFDKKIKENRERELPELHVHSGRSYVTNQEYFVPGLDNAGHRHAQTEFVAVRFGNVLGSNGSVIPLFKKQIAEGGPVTVTHPDIIRYFMTIPEAVSLVLLAGSYAKGGEIFVLDMGEPVKIADLAKNLIRLSGLKPDVDIKIEYTGLRPGEKLYEEKLMAEEGLQKTDNDLIHIGNPIPFDTDKFLADLLPLQDAAYANSDMIKQMVQEMVNTYHPAENAG